MNIKLATCILSLVTLSVSAQRQTNFWFFGTNAGISFETGTPQPTLESKINQSEGCASISDDCGNLLFYTDGSTIWNMEHQVMKNGTGLKGDQSSSQSALIVPMPGNKLTYYVFTADAASNSFLNDSVFAYSIVDMREDSGRGMVTTKNTTLMSPTAENITAVLHSNNKDYWIIAHSYLGNNFYSYLLTDTGLSPTPVMSSTGTAYFDQQAIGCLKLSPDGSKVATATNFSGFIELFDFDNSTGAISNPITLAPKGSSSADPRYYGVEFSPNSSKLYVTMAFQNDPIVKSALYQFDLNAGSNSDIINSKTIIHSSNQQSTYGSLQLARDSKLYVINLGNDSIGVVENPNEVGLACNYAHRAIPAGNGFAQWGLPNFVTSYFDPNYSTPLNTPNANFTFNDSICLGDTIDFQNTSSPGNLTSKFYDWNFGDESTSTDIHPSHLYESPGSYVVKLIATEGCTDDSISKNLYVIGKPETGISKKNCSL